MKLTRLALLLAALAWAAGALPVAAQELLLTRKEESFIPVEAQRREGGPVLLFSDSPELVYHDGILYRDRVVGANRLFFHHVNATGSDSKKLAVLLENTDSIRPISFEVRRMGVGDSAYNYLYEGKQGQWRYFSDEYQGQLALPRGALGQGRWAELLTGQGFVLEGKKLLSGTIDFYARHPLQLTVLLCDKDASLALFSRSAQVQPMDEHPLRGTFPVSEWEYRVKRPLVFKGRRARDYALKLASGAEGFVSGTDATTGLGAVDYGNYGVIYTVHFTIDSKEPVSFQFNPMGGEFAGWAILQQEGQPGQLIPLPGEQLSLGLGEEETIEVAKLGKGRYTFIWSPPGAGNLPVRLLWRGQPPPLS